MAAPGLSPIPPGGNVPEPAPPEPTPVFSKGERIVLGVVAVATLTAAVVITVLTALEDHPYLPLIGQ